MISLSPASEWQSEVSNSNYCTLYEKEFRINYSAYAYWLIQMRVEKSVILTPKWEYYRNACIRVNWTQSVDILYGSSVYGILPLRKY
jgi:hypothetical protein